MQPNIISALEASHLVLSLSEPDVGDNITNLKLQKLLYYLQGYHLAYFNTPLFEEELVKWQYGPVVAEVYHSFKQHGPQPIPKSKAINFEILTEEQTALFLDVYKVMGQFSALKLMDMTHTEKPFLSVDYSEVIPKEILKEYFTNFINKNEQNTTT